MTTPSKNKATKTDTKDPKAGETAPGDASALKEAPNSGSVTTGATTGTALATVDYGDDAGGGMEGVGAAELLIPFFRILQTNSPQVDENNGKFIEGAKAGMIINMSTGELIDGKKGIEFIPAHRDHYFAEFVPRDAGGGFQGIKQADDPQIVTLRKAQGEFGKLKMNVNDKNSNEFVDTFALYGLFVSRGEVAEGATLGDVEMVGRGIVSFASTQIKKYKAFITRYVGITYPGPGGRPVQPPLWAHRLLLQTVAESNKKGNFYGWKLTLINGEPPVKSRLEMTDPLYQQAKEFYALIKSGMARGDYAAEAAAGEEERKAGGDDEEIPF